MSSLAFNTHKFVTDLNKAGMDTSVAEVLANHYASLLNDRIATKDDLALLRTELKGDNSTLRTELKGDMAALEERMTSMVERLIVKIVAAKPASFLAVCAVFAAFFTLTGN